MTSALNPRFTFETFVVGAANRLAVTAGRTVAENPGSAYNPLFIYSGSGLGKTHVLMAVGHAAKAIAAQLNIEYLTLDEYVEAFHAAIAAGQGDAFRRRFQNVDVLLVDDVQFLTNRKEMQAELLRLTEALQQSGHQIVLASDRPPAEIADLDERLISRFSGGLVVDMGIPDYETRVAILRRKAEERGSSFQPGVLETVARLEYPNVRELMGALNRLIAFQAVNDMPINEEAARKVLGIPGTGDEGRGKGAPPPATPASSGDEFSQFLSDVTVTVGKAVEAWRARVAEAVMRWEGEGYRTGRLEKLLEQETPAAVDDAIAAYVQDVERLKALETEVAVLDPQAAGEKVFRDPDHMDQAEAAAAKVRAGAAPPPAPSGAFPFDSFVVGDSNDVARNAARDVISKPGKKYNPLVIVGRSGLGKTHLLNAIGLELAKKKNAVVACLSTQQFVDELIAAIDGNRVDWWRARYRRATALLLDDIQLLAGKERTQEELFNLFNQLVDADRQLIFTAPAHPNTLEGLEERIVSRLEGGLVAEISDPDKELRRNVLERLLTNQRVPIEPALLDYLADRPIDSVRSLTGIVQRVVEAAAAQDAPVTAGLARDVLEGAPPPRRTTGLRTSGIVVSSAGGVRSRERRVWAWPASADRSNFGYIYFDRGRISYASIVNRRDRLGDILVKHDKITQEQLDAAIHRQAKERDKKLGEILVIQNVLTQQELERYMRMQIEESVYYLFTWTQGTFNFEADVRPEQQDFLVSINPESLLLEGARRVDEWGLIEKKIPSFDLIFLVDRDRLAISDARLTEVQDRLLPLLDGSRDVNQVIEDSGLGALEGRSA